VAVVRSVNREKVVGRSWVGELKSSGKSFVISKWEVQEAWETVKANKGAPGVDGCSIEEFEKDLRNNLFKILESDVLGELLPAAGAGGGDTEIAGRHEGLGCADRGGSGRSDGGRQEAGAEGRADLSSGFLRLPARAFGPGRGRDLPAAVLEERLGD
jgi:hypothetical protein